MTKQEVKKKLIKSFITRDNLVEFEMDADMVIDEAYDDFESRTCGTCEYYENSVHYAGVKRDGNCLTLNINVRKDFGCNKWKAKDEQ